MKVLQPLPSWILGESISDREVVLDFDDAMRAIDSYEIAGWALFGWEGWFRQDGRNGHALEYQGTVALTRALDEDWPTYVKRTADICRRTIKESAERYARENTQQDRKLYFCLTASSSISE